VLQCVAVFCSVLQCVAVRYSVLHGVAVCCSALQCVARCCGCCGSLLEVNVERSICVAVCCSVLQCAARCCGCGSRTVGSQCRKIHLCCSVLQCVAVRCTVLWLLQVDHGKSIIEDQSVLQWCIDVVELLEVNVERSICVAECCGVL